MPWGDDVVVGAVHDEGGGIEGFECAGVVEGVEDEGAEEAVVGEHAAHGDEGGGEDERGGWGLVGECADDAGADGSAVVDDAVGIDEGVFGEDFLGACEVVDE